MLSQCLIVDSAIADVYMMQETVKGCAKNCCPLPPEPHKYPVLPILRLQISCQLSSQRAHRYLRVCLPTRSARSWAREGRWRAMSGEQTAHCYHADNIVQICRYHYPAGREARSSVFALCPLSGLFHLLVKRPAVKQRWRGGQRSTALLGLTPIDLPGVRLDNHAVILTRTVD